MRATCLHCREAFPLARPSEAGKRKYCSLRCQHDHRSAKARARNSRPCRQCAEPFHAEASRNGKKRKTSRPRFCSRACYSGHRARRAAFRMHVARATKAMIPAARLTMSPEELLARWPEGLHVPGMSPVQARAKINNGVQMGRVTKPSHCESCGGAASGYGMNAHHDDYEYPLRVRWLCVACHVAEHEGEWGQTA